MHASRLALGQVAARQSVSSIPVPASIHVVEIRFAAPLVAYMLLSMRMLD